MPYHLATLPLTRLNRSAPFRSMGFGIQRKRAKRLRLTSMILKKIIREKGVGLQTPCLTIVGLSFVSACRDGVNPVSATKNTSTVPRLVPKCNYSKRMEEGILVGVIPPHLSWGGRTMKREKLMIIDGNALVHRAWHAIPPTMKTSKGEVVNAVYGVTLALLRALKDLQPTYAIMTFDEKGPTFRDELFDAYKANREKKPDELYAQIPRIREVAESLGLFCVSKQGVEADDVIGTLAELFKKGTDVEILTGDLDTLQLIEDNVTVFTFKQGVKDMVVYDTAAVVARYGLVPDQMIDFKALRGDPSDNIPGVRGIGEKGAIELLKEFKTLEKLYGFLENSTIPSHLRGSTIKKLKEGKKDAFMSKELATIKRDVSVAIVKEDAEWQKGDTIKAQHLFTELEFKSLLPILQNLKKDNKETVLPLAIEQSSDGHVYRLVELDEDIVALCKRIEKQEIFSIDTETTSLNRLEARVIGISICWKAGDAYYIPFLGDRRPEQYKELVKLLESTACKKVAHNAKYDIEVLANHGITVHGMAFDTMIAAYLLRPDAASYSLDNLAFSEFGHQMIPITSLIGSRGKNQITMDMAPLDKVVEYGAEDADYTWQLYERLAQDITDEQLKKVLLDIEMPLVEVLARMERNGVELDVPFLKKMGKELGDKLSKLEQKIYSYAGREFNINSPSQLSEILFDDLQLSTRHAKKRIKGFSTASDVLERLEHEHLIIPCIMEYREYSKLKSTYIDALPKMVSTQTGRLHTDYNQAVAATGRLSSSNPNLQNIPIRTEVGRKIRHAFVAPKGKVLVAADYSQIELRLAAHLANDEKMIQIFKDKRDIHTETAAVINNVDIKDVTSDMRRAAKEVNFGVLYGMGWLGLSQRTGISRDEAQRFIEQYFALFPKVAEYVEETKALARKLGYVETAFGRRRYLPDMNATAPQLRALAERMAVNTPLQGTAADLMKLAMIAIDKKLQDRELIILQVHDELVFEVSEHRAEDVANMVVEEMETVEKFRVPIVVEVHVGHNWGSMKPL
ncbi:MAG: polymerase I protein [Parcubacteria group bacterium GW2011_GWA2_43_13]|nr:MAG: polymerase I protein [Parcubacteria group bacterium GW2011_GWA2_43_13]